ncbi:type VII secretion integral membrane protein EccD [Paractinoplanes brasiliensis]|uniref:Type VII secretion integral membrane protein EccD n=1 Tax=Paractinoplanes brasiliensis TaxID=52695 RepID=A0A4R6JLA7_9ACTN|nr:type VII secretion integral membrane protein EccD [Actinoplanes brasiliensis]TDO37084.1 type VII secretion integral membrane protein EccD [Actinoplanes brasiliensis]GID32222.1 hypothetical protein Abr02nite_72050 [Actinoplanes brasiliensis]
MSAVVHAGKCRITVVGPERRADLAVPVTSSVASLLPVLAGHVVTTSPDDMAAGSGWVLQRLGQAPFELGGTPETLDWLDGEELHLRRAEDPLPELDFDDVADGVATVINRRTDRWQPEYRRVLFLVLSLVAMAAIVRVVLELRPAIAQAGPACALAVALLAAAVVAGRKLDDGAYGLLFAGGSALFAVVAAITPVRGTAYQVLTGAVAVILVVTVLVVGQRTVARHLPLLPLLLLGVLALAVTAVVGSHLGLAVSGPRAAAVGAAALLAVIVLAPRVAVKVSGLRGPQLPKTGAEMQYDIEPENSDQLRSRTDDADTYLVAVLGASAVLLPFLFFFVLRTPDWSGWTLVAAVATALLLRARTFLGLWQRLALVVAGVAGSLMVLDRWAATASNGGPALLLIGLIVLLVPLVMAAMRPWPRRMLPFWEYTATFFDIVTALAVLPVLAQVLGLYGWARGLFG